MVLGSILLSILPQLSQKISIGHFKMSNVTQKDSTRFIQSRELWRTLVNCDTSNGTSFLMSILVTFEGKVLRKPRKLFCAQNE